MAAGREPQRHMGSHDGAGPRAARSRDTGLDAGLDERLDDDLDVHAEGPSTADLLIRLLDGTVSAFAKRPAKVRTKLSPGGALRGRVDVVVFELQGLKATGLVIDRVVVHAEQLRVEPGLPPRLKAGPVGFKATVSQAAVERWTKATHLPVHLLLTPEGVVARAGLGGVRLTEVAVELAAVGRLLQLRPTRASMLGLPAPMVGILRGYLPLPPLPLGAKVRRVEPADATLTVWFELPDVDEPLSPAIAGHLRKRLLRI